MNFGGWISLDEAPVAAPQTPGVLQARADALLTYPRGKSAMVLYAAGLPEETLRRYLGSEPGARTLRRAAAQGARWVRFAASATPDVDCARLLLQFVDRFGAPPVATPDDPTLHEEARFIDG